MIFTAGTEGTVRLFQLPGVQEVNPYGDTYDGKNYCIGQWTVGEMTEVVWDLKHHGYSALLAGCTAGGGVLVWNTQDLNDEKVVMNV